MFSPFQRPELPAFGLLLNLHLLLSSRREQPVRPTRFRFGSSPPDSRTPGNHRSGWRGPARGRSGGVLSKSFPLRPRPRFLPKCSSKLPPSDPPRPFLLILRRPAKTRAWTESWQSACFSAALTSARLPASNMKHRPYRFLAVIRPLPGDGTAGSRSCVLAGRGAGGEP